MVGDDPQFDLLKKCMDIFEAVVEQVKANDEVRQRLLKEFSESNMILGELPGILQQEDPDVDEYELALTDLSMNALEKVYYDILLKISTIQKEND